MLSSYHDDAIRVAALVVDGTPAVDREGLAKY
jgi:hypothetical protein